MPAMSTDMSISTNGKARNFPFYRTFPRLIRDPLKEIEQIGKMSGGDLVQVDFGVFRAYVATHPDHVQHILRDNSANFLRGRPVAFAPGVVGDRRDVDPGRVRDHPGRGRVVPREANSLVATSTMRSRPPGSLDEAQVSTTRLSVNRLMNRSDREDHRDARDDEHAGGPLDLRTGA